MSRDFILQRPYEQWRDAYLLSQKEMCSDGGLELGKSSERCSAKTQILEDRKGETKHTSGNSV